MSKRNLKGILVSLAAVTASWCTLLSAATIEIDTFLTGDDGGSAVAAVLQLDQNGSNVDFVLTNSISNLSPLTNSSSFLESLGFNFDGMLSANQFTNFGGVGQSIDATNFSTNPSGNFQGGYDFFIELGLPRSNAQQGAFRFFDGESLSWTITNVLLDDFLSPVTGTGPAVLAAVHIQGLAGGTSTTYGGIGTSTTSVVPLPAAAWFFLTGLAGLAGVKRLRGTPATA